MPTTRGRIVIVDDKQEEGQQLAAALWSAGLPVLFARYEPDLWSEETKNPYRNMQGIRVIMLDIDLLGSGMRNNDKQLFGVLVSALDSLLHDNNGPYYLVLWTRYHEHASSLYEHLRQRLPESKRPSFYKMLNKEDYLVGTNSTALKAKVVEFLEEFSPLRALAVWEGSVQLAACEVAADIAKTSASESPVASDKVFAARMSLLLKLLAEAEAGKHLAPADVSRPLSSVLTSLLSDRLHAELARPLPLGEPEPVEEQKLIPWKHRINAMLNFESRPTQGGPGVLYSYPLGRDHGLPIPCHDERTAGKLLRGQFLYPRLSLDEAEKQRIEKTASLLFMEITPPCDHSQRKALWRRFIVGAKLPESCWTHLWDRESKQEDSADKQQIILEGRVSSQNLWVSPPMRPIGDKESFRLVLNSRMVASIPENTSNLDQHFESRRSGRIREQMFADILGWFGRQATRTGHLSLQEDSRKTE